MVFLSAWRKSDAAIAHDDGCRAEVRGRSHVIVPGGLAIVMCMHVDKAGGHNFPGCIDLTVCSSRDVCRDFRDDAVLNSNIQLPGWSTGAVEDVAVFYDQVVVSHCKFSSFKDASTLAFYSPRINKC